MTMKEGMMKGIAFISTGKYAHVERPIPKIEKNHDVLVKILATSICGTDVHILATPPLYPATPGKIIGCLLYTSSSNVHSTEWKLKENDVWICHDQ